MKILIVGSQHGNEHSGEKLFDHVTQKHPDLSAVVTFIIANPRARKQNIRYSESDMKRSYDRGSNTYEERRADQILKLVNEGNYNLVLDMHTTTVDQDPCLIVGGLNTSNRAFLSASSFRHIVVMGSIADHALTGLVGHSIAIEVFEEMNNDLLESICNDMKRYIHGESSDITKYVYDDTELLSKDEDYRKLENFVRSEQGYYPIMLGERAYVDHTDYVGFKAYKRYEFKV